MVGQGRFKNSVVISLTLHALAFLLLFFAWMQQVQNPTAPIEVQWLPTPTQVQEKENQIVDTRGNETTEEVADTQFLSDKNRKVQRQTVAKKTSNKPTQATAGALSKLGVSFLPKTDDGAGSRKADRPQADFSKFQSTVAESQTSGEYVKGLKESESTALNTKEFVFFGYFQRIRSQLDQAWQPILRKQIISLFQKGRRLASDMDYLTRALVVLNTEGEVIEVKILEESGARALDDSAVRAFNQAGPFPNPPRGIADSSGKIQIRWDFILRT